MPTVRRDHAWSHFFANASRREAESLVLHHIYVADVAALLFMLSLLVSHLPIASIPLRIEYGCNRRTRDPELKASPHLNVVTTTSAPRSPQMAELTSETYTET